MVRGPQWTVNCGFSSILEAARTQPQAEVARGSMGTYYLGATVTAILFLLHSGCVAFVPTLISFDTPLVAHIHTVVDCFSTFSRPGPSSMR
ncbi:hypothetical protein FOMPIDRAFT_1026525 [Fomitopsis schrenkii]|uniref:Uncharacterized protein n=1 Tax=Fomitopsis schrenkii TaxID=2126942 RepID=S8DL52_FOMSC|nr:hypothetical protein FOMPIDRAFT_1026525 [Fomitopsis schrenkii]